MSEEEKNDLPVKKKRKPRSDAAIAPLRGAITNPTNRQVIQNIGDPRVTEFIDFQIKCLEIREGSDTHDVPGLYHRFQQYVMYCRENGILPTNMTCYLACGVGRDLISLWYLEKNGSKEQHEFAVTVKQFLASVREGAATSGILNTVYAIYLQKAHDGMSDQPMPEVYTSDPLGEKQSAEQIAAKYADVELPD